MILGPGAKGCAGTRGIAPRVRSAPEPEKMPGSYRLQRRVKPAPAGSRGGTRAASAEVQPGSNTETEHHLSGNCEHPRRIHLRMRRGTEEPRTQSTPMLRSIPQRTPFKKDRCSEVSVRIEPPGGVEGIPQCVGREDHSALDWAWRAQSARGSGYAQGQ